MFCKFAMKACLSVAAERSGKSRTQANSLCWLARSFGPPPGIRISHPFLSISSRCISPFAGEGPTTRDLDEG